MSATTVLSPLSVALREGTRSEHETAERSGFVELLLSGRLDRAAYADLAAQQLVVYTALEAAGAQLTNDGADAGLVFAELKDPVRNKVNRYELTRVIDPAHFFPTLDAAVRAFQQETGTRWSRIEHG